jgi:archaellum component FlaC
MDIIYGNKQIIESFRQVAQYFSFITEEDLGVFVYNRDELLAYIPSKKIDLGLIPGSPVKQGAMPDKCMKSGQRLVTLVTAEKSRVKIPYLSVATPIMEGKEVIGCIITNQTLDVYYKLMQAGEGLAESAASLKESMVSVDQNAHGLEKGVETLKNLENTLKNNIKSSAEMVTFVQNLARQTNLLGVNAAIEAARAGQYGKGFSVVANEIRNMANNSSHSVESITDNLNSINKEVDHLTEFSNSLENSVVEQSTAIQEIQKALDSLHQITAELVGISKSMFGITDVV